MSLSTLKRYNDLYIPEEEECVNNLEQLISHIKTQPDYGDSILTNEYEMMKNAFMLLSIKINTLQPIIRERTRMRCNTLLKEFGCNRCYYNYYNVSISVEDSRFNDMITSIYNSPSYAFYIIFNLPNPEKQEGTLHKIHYCYGPEICYGPEFKYFTQLDYVKNGIKWRSEYYEGPKFNEMLVKTITYTESGSNEWLHTRFKNSTYISQNTIKERGRITHKFYYNYCYDKKIYIMLKQETYAGDASKEYKIKTVSYLDRFGIKNVEVLFTKYNATSKMHQINLITNNKITSQKHFNYVTGSLIKEEISDQYSNYLIYTIFYKGEKGKERKDKDVYDDGSIMVYETHTTKAGVITVPFYLINYNLEFIEIYNIDGNRINYQEPFNLINLKSLASRNTHNICSICSRTGAIHEYTSCSDRCHCYLCEECFLKEYNLSSEPTCKKCGIKSHISLLTDKSE